MKNRNLLNFIFSSAAINIGLWAAIITVGLMGCYGSMTIAQCAYAWIVITAGALITKILIGINLLNGRQSRKNTYSNTSIMPSAKFKSQGARRMNADDFVKTSVLLGYCDKKTALDYTLEHKKQDYDSNDYIEVYRRGEKKIVKDESAKKATSPAYYLSRRTSRVYTGVWRW